jgi:hypothetical protein
LLVDSASRDLSPLSPCASRSAGVARHSLVDTRHFDLEFAQAEGGTVEGAYCVSSSSISNTMPVPSRTKRIHPTCLETAPLICRERRFQPRKAIARIPLDPGREPARPTGADAHQSNGRRVMAASSVTKFGRRNETRT